MPVPNLTPKPLSGVPMESGHRPDAALQVRGFASGGEDYIPVVSSISPVVTQRLRITVEMSLYFILNVVPVSFSRSSRRSPSLIRYWSSQSRQICEMNFCDVLRISGPAYTYRFLVGNGNTED